MAVERKAMGAADVDERGIEGGYIASVGNALKANSFDVEGSTKCRSGALLRNTRV